MDSALAAVFDLHKGFNDFGYEKGEKSTGCQLITYYFQMALLIDDVMTFIHIGLLASC